MTQRGTSPIRLLLVDDHTLFRESLRRMLESEDAMTVVGDYACGEDVLDALRAGLQFDAALVDYDLGQPGSAGKSGVELAQAMRALLPDANILMVTAGMDTSLLRRAVGDLRVGIFLKTEPTDELLLAIQRTARGEQWVSSRASLALLAEPMQAEMEEQSRLTERESCVLQAVLAGQSNKEIGAQLGISESAVKAVLQKLFAKTGVRTRSQLVRYALESRMEPRVPVDVEPRE